MQLNGIKKSNNHYIIHGPIVDDAPTFWNQEAEEWTSDEDYATKMTRDVLTIPLPIGSIAVIEENTNGIPQSFLYSIPSIGGNIFEKLD